jgi:hypothetical protein
MRVMVEKTIRLVLSYLPSVKRHAYCARLTELNDGNAPSLRQNRLLLVQDTDVNLNTQICGRSLRYSLRMPKFPTYGLAWEEVKMLLPSLGLAWEVELSPPSLGLAWE